MAPGTWEAAADGLLSHLSSFPKLNASPRLALPGLHLQPVTDTPRPDGRGLFLLPFGSPWGVWGIFLVTAKADVWSQRSWTNLGNCHQRATSITKDDNGTMYSCRLGNTVPLQHGLTPLISEAVSAEDTRHLTSGG